MTGDPRTARGGVVPGAGVLGMWVFLASLAVLFIAAIVGFLIVRLRADGGPPTAPLRLPIGMWAATMVLLAGSVSIHRALHAIRGGRQTACSRLLAVALVLGVLFLAVQSWNWWELIRRSLTASSNLGAFTFFMLTGLHAAHVIGGFALLAIVWERSRRGRYDGQLHSGVTYAAMYWHFLDGVWLVLFAVLFTLA